MKVKLKWLKNYWVYILVSILGVPFIIVFIKFVLKFQNQTPSENPNDWATFATFISGTIGTVIGLVSIILLYQTLVSQSRLSRLQQFESSFFSLLENQREIINSMKGTVKIRKPMKEGQNDNVAEGSNFIEKIAKALDDTLAPVMGWDSKEIIKSSRFEKADSRANAFKISSYSH